MGKRELKPEKNTTFVPVLFFVLLAAAYLLIFFGLSRTPVFDLTGGHNDRFFSADDLYYVTKIYGLPMDTSPQIIKHPLLAGFGALFTFAERALLGEVSQVLHYELIVMAQLLAALASVFYLYRIFKERYKLPLAGSLILCSIYGFAVSTLFYTFIAESYIWSSLILIMTYYYAGKEKTGATIVLGALAAGVTITNAVLWAIIVGASGRNRKKVLLTWVGGGLLFCAVVAVLPIGRLFFTNILTGGMNSAQNYSDHYSIPEMLKRTFFSFFGSTVFYIDTAHASPFGDFPGDALSFLPSANPAIVLLGLVWMGLLICAVILFRRDRRLWPPLAVLGCNLALHGLVQYGLKESFLYSLHHLSAQILIAGLLLVPERKGRRKEQKILLLILAVYFVMEILLNLPGYREMLQLVMK